MCWIACKFWRSIVLFFIDYQIYYTYSYFIDLIRVEVGRVQGEDEHSTLVCLENQDCKQVVWEGMSKTNSIVYTAVS